MAMRKALGNSERSILCTVVCGLWWAFAEEEAIHWRADDSESGLIANGRSCMLDWRSPPPPVIVITDEESVREVLCHCLLRQ